MSKETKIRCKRRRLFADTQIQGGLCIRVTVYWLVCQMVTLAAMFGLACLNNEGYQAISGLVVPVFIAGIVVLPLALLDLVFFSNRFAGPIRNFRGRFNLLAKGQRVGAMYFRPGDFLGDLCENFNKLRASIQSDSSIEVGSRDLEQEKELTKV